MVFLVSNTVHRNNSSHPLLYQPDGCGRSFPQIAVPGHQSSYVNRFCYRRLYAMAIGHLGVADNRHGDRSLRRQYHRRSEVHPSGHSEQSVEKRIQAYSPSQCSASGTHQQASIVHLHCFYRIGIQFPLSGHYHYQYIAYDGYGSRIRRINRMCHLKYRQHGPRSGRYRSSLFVERTARCSQMAALSSDVAGTSGIVHCFAALHSRFLEKELINGKKVLKRLFFVIST